MHGWRTLVILPARLRFERLRQDIDEGFERGEIVAFDGGFDHRLDLMVSRDVERIDLQHRLPARTGDALFDALQGIRLHRPGYVERAGIEDRTGTRDLVRLTELGVLDAVGKTRSRHYVAGPLLRAERAALDGARAPLEDPYPWLPAQLRSSTPR